MKIKFLPIIIQLLVVIPSVYAQNIGINSTGVNAHPSALLDVDASPANNRGLLIPRIPLQAINQATPVVTPTVSLLVYNTATASTGTNAVSPGYYYWDGAKWLRLINSFNDNDNQTLSITGNSVSISSGNSIILPAEVDGSVTNEIQALSISGSTISLSNGGGSVNLPSAFTPSGTANGDLNGTYPNPTVDGLQGQPVSVTTPTTGQVLTWTGTAWTPTNIPITNWSLLGNSGTTASTNFLGTTDAQDLVFKTNNIEKMRVLSGGNVGVGTSAPLAMLHLYSSTADAMIIERNSSFNAHIQYKNSLSNAYAGLSPLGNYAIGFNVDLNVNPAITVLNSNNNVGINTLSPANRLEIKHGTNGNSGLRLTNLTNINVLATDVNGDIIPSTATTATNNAVFWGLVGNNGTNPITNFIGTLDAKDLVFRTNNTEKVRLLSNGNLGVSNIIPTSKLQVIDYYDTTQVLKPFQTITDRLPGISVYNTSDFIGLSNIDKDNSLTTTNDFDAMLYWGDDGDEDLRFNFLKWNGVNKLYHKEYMRIKGGTGNIGINNNNPQTKLSIKTLTVGTGFQLEDGSEANGKVLMSDVNGRGMWQSPASIRPTIIGVPSSLSSTIAINSPNTYTDAYIDLPVGKWAVSVVTILKLTKGVLSDDEGYWIRTTFCESSTVYLPTADFQGSSYYSGALTGPCMYGLLTGTNIINNTSGATKRYYFWKIGSDAYGSNASLSNELHKLGGPWAETQFVAQPVN